MRCEGAGQRVPALPLLLLLLLLLRTGVAAPAHAGGGMGREAGGDGCEEGARYMPDICNECVCRSEEDSHLLFRCTRRICLDVNPDIGFTF